MRAAPAFQLSLRRFALWLRDWVIAFAIVVAVGVLIVWLR